MAQTDFCGVPNGYQAFVLSELTKKHPLICIITPNDKQLIYLKETINLLQPHLSVLCLPNWDTVPYDRVSPKADIVSERIATFIQLANQSHKNPLVVLTTASALLQKTPSPDFFKQASLTLKVGETLPFEALKKFLNTNGYHATNTVMEHGEYAVRGGLTDIFPSGSQHPIRIDFFGDEIDSIKYFDEITQRTLQTVQEIHLHPIAEYRLTTENIALFRTRYRSLFNFGTHDYFYESVSNGIAPNGIEHFLPLLHSETATVFDYLKESVFILDYQAFDAIQSRYEQINEYYQARQTALATVVTDSNDKYFPIPPKLFFLTPDDIQTRLQQHICYTFSPFIEPNKTDKNARLGQSYVDIRLQTDKDVFDCVADTIRNESRKCIITAQTFGATQRLLGIFREHRLSLYEAHDWKEAVKNAPSVLTAPFTTGFSDKNICLITESDILGERQIRTARKIRAKNFITDVSTLNINDYVVHQMHGIGQYIGLIPIQTGTVTHDCVALQYAHGDKLFVPVENIDILSKYGSENVTLDTLGSQSFAQRKERVKKDLFAMAEKLIGIASQRALNKTEQILAPHGSYQEFCMRFPYAETDDQLRTIQEIETDLAGGRPMDRLVCGDVGFGKTEMALRAAFLTAMNGFQVAVIAPTTLLALQHAKTFEERFKGFPIRVASLSRLVSSSKAKLIRDELATGTLDIIISTHALLSKNIRFKRLGLVVVDEEQHFGVTHKERLKELQKGVHVLTLTATPIPRTLQLSLSGVRDLSVIATPPVDRLAVKTFVTPFDTVIIKEAILREHFRGGQIFFVCPRISDMPEVKQILAQIVPDIRIVEAHGQMPASQLEQIMTDFADKKYDILLATSIVESGLDISSVNTIIVYRADMFGLAGLYQLRGRVGRGKLRAYAYLTTPPHQRLNDTAQKRLKVMQSLDSLGAGFTLASHDLDIRGAGNLLGQEQSGHIREVGVALYQKMLSDAIHALKSGQSQTTADHFSPQISIGLPVVIPETYIRDLETRMQLYTQIGNIESDTELEDFKTELIDRFGKYPTEVENLFTSIHLKLLCKKAYIERLDAGEKGATISFWNNTFPNPLGLVDFINTQMGTVRLRPDQKLVVMRPWGDLKTRLNGIEKLLIAVAEKV